MNTEPTQLEIALAAADAGNAGHWPTVAGILADEYRKLKSQSNMKIIEGETITRRSPIFECENCGRRSSISQMHRKADSNRLTCHCGKDSTIYLRPPLLNSTRTTERESPREPIGRDGVGDFLLRQAITHIAAELAMCHGMPPTDPSDWNFDPATPHADRLKILEWARASQSQCKTWSRKLKEIADPLVRKVEEMAGPIQDYQRSILAGLLAPLASEREREAAESDDGQPDTPQLSPV